MIRNRTPLEITSIPGDATESESGSGGSGETEETFAGVRIRTICAAGLTRPGWRGRLTRPADAAA
jgi:hypothetical protein